MIDNSAKDAIFKMFLCFPSATKLDEVTAATMTAAYLETVQGFSSEIVCAACDNVRRRKQPFPPSAGELYDACSELMRHRRERENWEKSRNLGPAPRLTGPRRHSYTDGELADWSLIINGKGGKYVMREKGSVPLVIPHGYPNGGESVFYGYLTPAEVAAANTRALSPHSGAAA